jgi:hypothetical protein
LCGWDYLLTEKTASKEISALTSVTGARVRYDRTVPFRADDSDQLMEISCVPVSDVNCFLFTPAGL